MDLGAVVGFDGLVTSGDNTSSTPLPSANSDPQSKWYGSGFLNQQRPAGDEHVAGGDDWKKGMLSFSTTTSPSSSSYPSKAQKTCNSLPYFHLTASPRNSSGHYYPSSGGASFSFNGGSMMMMHGGSAGGGGVFTPSQWMELEHQALIFKYLTSNVAVPITLLTPIRKALESAAYSSFSSSAGFLRPNSLGWGPFHLGYSSSSDPEPGRCRRTDGKKWRCSRDAVPDQKYCERHINRGRHRSRKPVEVHSAATTNNTTATAAAAAATKGIPAATTTAASSASAAAAGATSRGYGSSSSNLPAQSLHHQNNDLLASTPLGRMFVNKETTGDIVQQTPSLSMIPANSTGLRSNENSPFVISKQHDPYAESSSQTAFGLVSSESLLNPSQKPSSLINCRSFSSSQDHQLGDQQEQQHSLRQFMDDWPKTHQPDHHNHHHRRFGSSSSNSSHSSWQESADRTQLSISIPISHNAAADFMSSTSSPDNDKVNVQMGLGVGNGENNLRQTANWIPISWEASMGGPLGEVLHNTNNTTTTNAGGGSGGDQCSKNSSLSSAALNLMTEGWDSSPHHMTSSSSPTGVLQRTAFGSLSNSSAGSSPRADNNNNNNYSYKTNNSSSHCNNGLVVHSSSLLPAL